MRNRFIRWSPCLIWMAVIFSLSQQTGSDLNTFLPFFQRFFPQMQSFDWGHFAAYFLLALAFLWAFGGSQPDWRLKLLTVLFCLLYGLTDEFHQTFVPGRTADWHDLRNDGIGAALAMLAVSLPPIARLYAKLPHTKKY